MAENKYFALQVSEPDGVVLIIQGNNLNCRLLKSHEKPGVLWLEFYKVESQEYSNCPVSHAVKPVSEVKAGSGRECMWLWDKGPRKLEILSSTCRMLS